jgi:hypothetical protein
VVNERSIDRKAARARGKNEDGGRRMEDGLMSVSIF